MYTRKYNFSVTPGLVEQEWTCWPWVEENDHTRAFVHYCKRQGHKVYVKVKGDQMRVALKRKL